MQRSPSARLVSLLPSLQQLRAAPLLLALAGTAMVSHFLRDGHTDQRLLQLAFIAFASLMMLLRRVAGPPSPQLTRTGFLCLACFFALGALSAAFAFSPRFAMMEVCLFLVLLLIGLAAGREMSSGYPGALTALLNIVGIGCALYVFQSLVVYATAIGTAVAPSQYAFAPGFSNQRFFNHAQTITLPLLALLVCRQPKGRARLAWFLIAAYWWALLFVLGGKATILASAAGALCTALLMRGRARRFLAAFAGSALAGLVLMGLLFVLLPPWFDMQPFLFMETTAADGSVAPSAHTRFALWRRAVELMYAAPLLGVGPMQYGHYAFDLGIAAHPHNWVLQLGVEWGIPALLAFCVALCIGVRALLACIRTLGDDGQHQMTASALLAIGVALLVDGLLSGSLVMPVSQLLITVYLACVVGWVRSMGPSAARTRSAMDRPARLLAVLAAACVIGGALQDIGKDGPPGSTVERPAIQDSQWPRFWAVLMF